MEHERAHPLFVIGVYEVTAEIGMLCRLVNDLLIVALDSQLLSQEPRDLPAARAVLSADGYYHNTASVAFL